MLQIWTSRNEDDKSATIQFPPNMLSDLNGIYAARDRLPPHVQNRIFHITKEELLTRPKKYIQTWIQRIKPHIQTKLKIQAKQQQTHNQDIWTFPPPINKPFPATVPVFFINPSSHESPIIRDNTIKQEF